MGKRTYEIALMGYPKAKATRSEFSFAIIFGVISPKVRTITVETATETAPLSDVGNCFFKDVVEQNREGYVHDVVAHENRGKEFVEIFRQCERVLGGFVAVLRFELELCPVQRAECRLRRGKESGKCHQYYYENY